MKISIELDLDRYDNETILMLFKERVLTETEVIEELMSRGLKEWKAIMAVRAVG